MNFLCDIYGVEDRENKIVNLTKKFEIYDVLNNKLESFSHGMRQKIVLIGALLHNPNNWILDEPMTGLDPKSSFDLKEMMREHADEGKTVFFSTHVLEVAEKMCDRIGIISKGKLLFVGTVEQAREQFAKEGSLEKVFWRLQKMLRRILSLSKVLIKTNIIDAFSKQQGLGKRKLSTIILLILAYGYLCVIVGIFSYETINSLMAFNQQTAFISLVCLINVISTLFETVFTSANILYFSKDNEHLLPLPFHHLKFLLVN